MIKYLQNGCAALCIFLSTSLFAQQHPNETRIISSSKINFTELAQKELQHPSTVTTPRYIEFRRELPGGITRNRPVTGDVQLSGINIPDETDLSTQASLTSPGPLRTFTGITDNNTVIPPDVMGAAGPTYLMETLNSFYRIYSKTGTSVAGVTPASFWSPIGSFVTDPHLAYDSLSKRWITCCIGKLTNGHYAFFVGVTQNSDPTGTWFIYAIDTGSGSTFPDYPLLGYNSKWVVVTTNDFLSNGSFNAVRIVVLNKSQLLSGSPVAVHTFFDNTIFTLSPAETLDPNQGTEYLLADYNGNSAGKGYIRASTITGTTGSPVYTIKSLIAVNSPWSETSVDEPQKGTSRLIDGGDARMGKLILRNGSIWASQTVFLPASSPTHSAVQWWQINPATNAVQQLGRISNSTGAFSFAFPSIAVTASNNVLIGCSLFGSTIYASAAYAYRNHTDASGTLRSLYNYKGGGNTYYKTYGGSRNRWGDYSATCVDYTNGTFWTLQEIATSTANTWGTWWANVGGATAISVIAENTAVESNLSNALISISPNPAKGTTTLRWQSSKPGNAVISIINTQGTTVSTRKIQVVTGNNQQNISTGDLSNGTYIVTFAMDNDIRRTRLIIEK